MVEGGKIKAPRCPTMMDVHKALDTFHLGLAEAVVAASRKLDNLEVPWLNEVEQFDTVTMEQLADCPARFKGLDRKLVRDVLGPMKKADKDFARETSLIQNNLIKKNLMITGREALRLFYVRMRQPKGEEQVSDEIMLHQLEYKNYKDGKLVDFLRTLDCPEG